MNEFEEMIKGMPDMQAAALRCEIDEAIAALAPALDFADGVRAELRRRGWSETGAEQLAIVIVTAHSPDESDDEE